jgi:hypothetical protein
MRPVRRIAVIAQKHRLAAGAHEYDRAVRDLCHGPSVLPNHMIITRTQPAALMFLNAGAISSKFRGGHVGAAPATS